MITGLKTVYSGMAATMAKGLKATTRQMRIWLEDAYEETLWFWHREIRPKHFEESATAEYRYRPRSAEYERGKEKAVGHRRPLVYSGESELATRQAWLTVTARSATLHMGAGNLVWHSMREEVKAMTTADKQAMANVMERSMDRALNTRYDYFERILMRSGQ